MATFKVSKPSKVCSFVSTMTHEVHVGSGYCKHSCKWCMSSNKEQVVCGFKRTWK